MQIDKTIFKKIDKFLDRTIIGIANIFLIAITAAVTVEVISRKVFNHSFVFVTPLTEFLFPWLEFLAIIIITKDEEHIAVSYFFDKFPLKSKIFVAVINRLIMLFFSVSMMISSYHLSMDSQNINIPILDIAKFWYYISMTIAFLATSIYILIQMILVIIKRNVGEDKFDLDNDN